MLFLALACSACGEDTPFVPTTPTGPVIPTIGGTYSSPTMWRFELAWEGGSSVFTCAGSLTIANQLGTTFSGTYIVDDPNCGRISGTVTSGTLASNGDVTFALNVAAPDPNLLTFAFGCTYVSGDQVVSGTLVGSQLQAGSRTVMDCTREGRSTMTLRIAGSR